MLLTVTVEAQRAGSQVWSIRNIFTQEEKNGRLETREELKGRAQKMCDRWARMEPLTRFRLAEGK